MVALKEGVKDPRLKMPGVVYCGCRLLLCCICPYEQINPALTGRIRSYGYDLLLMPRHCGVGEECSMRTRHRDERIILDTHTVLVYLVAVHTRDAQSETR